MIEKAFLEAKGKSILFLGRLKNFTVEEVEIFLKQYGADFTDSYSEDVAVVVESSMLNPYEEEISYEVYKKKLSTFRLDEFEQMYAKKIKPDLLLMSLKLSNDQSRIIRLLKNESFEKSLYLKLFKLYDWQGMEVHESDENRDVTTSFVKRFYNPDQFMDPAMVYSPITLMTIVAECEDADVLEAMLSFAPYEIKVSKNERRPKSLKEIIALNPHANKETLKALARLRNQEIDFFLVQNDSLSFDLQEEIYRRANYDIKRMLALNENLSDELFKELLAEEDDDIVASLLIFSHIDTRRLEEVRGHKNFYMIGEGEGIGNVIDILLEIDDVALQQALAANPLLCEKSLESIYRRYEEDVKSSLSSNPNTPLSLLESFAKEGRYDEILAANPSTPEAILLGYFERGDEALNRALASNVSLPTSCLQQLQLEPSLMNILSENETFTKNLLKGLGI